MQLFGVVELPRSTRSSDHGRRPRRRCGRRADQFAEIGRDHERRPLPRARHSGSRHRFLRARRHRRRPSVHPAAARAAADHSILRTRPFAGCRRRVFLTRLNAARRFHRKPGAPGFRTPGGGALLHPAPAREMRNARQGEVSLDRMVEDQTLHVPVFRHQRDALLDRHRRALGSHRRPSISIAPLSSGRAQNTGLQNLVRPLPISPARPWISPFSTDRSTARRRSLD